ncbi:flagellar basal body L-ring protein FlgH [Thermoproteota archaeon]
MIRHLLKYSAIISIALIISGPQAVSDSLWNPAQGNPYGSIRRQIRVGDVITVYISETTSAVQEATTRTSKESELRSNILSGWDQIANLLGNETLRKEYEFELRGEDGYSGLGSTARKSKVQALVTAVVTEILENGNVYVIGEKKVKVNNEVETIRISGIVQPGDIRADNSVFSHQIAKAEVSVNGEGVVGAKQTPGILTKIFNWFF